MKIFSHSLQGRRESNEDQHIHILNLPDEKNVKLDPNLNPVNFIGVFDGHGGKSISKFLKDKLPYYFVNKFTNDIYLNTSTASKYFIKVYNLIQKQLIDEHPLASVRCGSTACVGIHFKDEKNKDKLWILNVGDSRAVKCNGTNIAEQLTQDHKPNSPSEKVRIEKLGGKIEFDGSDWRIKDLSLSRAFGDLDCVPYVTHLPQIYKYKINSSDKFMIFACDGLWDVISNQDAVDYINELSNNNFKGNYAKELATCAYKKGSLDNITVIVYLINI
jgi:serine/threonine protein phosphatase PrpC